MPGAAARAAMPRAAPAAGRENASEAPAACAALKRARGMAELIAKAIDGQPHRSLPAADRHAAAAQGALLRGDVAAAHARRRDRRRPSDFIDVAEGAGLMPQIDNLLLFRCVQVMRRLQLKNRDVGLFCNIGAATLADAGRVQAIPRIHRRQPRARRRADASSSARAPIAPSARSSTRALAALAERGFRFSMDHVTDLRMEPKELADRCFRFLKVPATLLLDKSASARSDIHPAGPRRPVGALRHRPHRRAHREREHGGRPARLRRALRPGLPVLAAASGAGGGAAAASPARRPMPPPAAEAPPARAVAAR